MDLRVSKIGSAPILNPWEGPQSTILIFTSPHYIAAEAIYFTNIPIPFRLGMTIYASGNGCDVIGFEELNAPRLTGGSVPCKLDD
ncbi:hypothetical protein BLNAU_19566 [Blattamonas nauphoetae]|uniref:Uncharacterized protein n=1 Tax=Blattamonas nauphoetae TaxID=2049346 RepID=A0ABQ9X1N8_9EUKA|nr:hypothetical protein BLNAU_19566 [Blattamonas nauphoetae]